LLIAGIFTTEGGECKKYMRQKMRKLVAGNWKMNGLRDSLENIAELATAQVHALI